MKQYPLYYWGKHAAILEKVVNNVCFAKTVCQKVLIYCFNIVLLENYTHAEWALSNQRIVTPWACGIISYDRWDVKFFFVFRCVSPPCVTKFHHKKWSAESADISEPPADECIPSLLAMVTSEQTQNICITVFQRRPNVFAVEQTLYKCYTNILHLLVWVSFVFRDTLSGCGLSCLQNANYIIVCIVVISNSYPWCSVQVSIIIIWYFRQSLFQYKLLIYNIFKGTCRL